MSGKGHFNKAICGGSRLHLDAERETLVISGALLPLFKEAESAANHVLTAAEGLLQNTRCFWIFIFVMLVAASAFVTAVACGFFLHTLFLA